MSLILLGLGGSWLAIFGKIAAVGFYVAAASMLLLLAGWIIALRRHSPLRTAATRPCAPWFTSASAPR